MKKKNSLSLFLNYHLQHSKVQIFLNFILFIVLLISLNINIFDISYNFKVGDVSPLTIISNKTMDYVDSVATEDKRKGEKDTFIPVFVLDMTVYESKIVILEEIMSTLNNSSYDTDEKTDKIESLLKYLISQKKMQSFDSRELLKIDKKRFMERIKPILYSIYQAGVFKFIKNGYDIKQFSDKLIKVKILENNTNVREYRRFNHFIYSDITYFEFLKYISEQYGIKKENKVFLELLYLLIEDNLYENKYDSEQELNNRLSRIQPIMKKIKEDEFIVRKGEKINQETLDKIKALKFFERKNFIAKFVFSLVLSLFFIVLLNFMIRIENKNLFNDSKRMTLIFLFLLFNILLIYLSFNILSFLTFPIGILFPVTMSIYMISVIIGFRISFLMTIAIAVIYAIFLVFYRADTLYSIFYILLLGITITLAAKNVHRRDQIIRVSFYCIFPYLILTSVYILYFPNYIEDEHINSAIVWSVLNPILSGVLSIGLIPVFERVFNMVTSFRLLELANLSSKILNDMHILAPGTYHHSLMVSHLAEAAANEIGADYLLARVGGLYHDIGKLSNPHYFSENQDYDGNNIHEDVSPQVSATILKSHITQGIKKAKEMDLPEQVIHFISQHHGTSIMEYFYHKALESQEESEVDLPRFRYGGPKPQTKETAIVMLSDAIEAGVRALPSKRYDLIEEKISMIISSKINSGELSESPLTLEDIKKVEEIFKKLMFAYYHTRPVYPTDRELNEDEEEDEFSR